MTDSKYKKYWGWGVFNGIILGISITQNIDISEEGILTELLNSFKPLMIDVGLSIGWITTLTILIGLIGIASLVFESIQVYNKGWVAIFFAITGFLGFLLILLGWNKGGVFFIVLAMLGFFIETIAEKK